MQLWSSPQLFIWSLGILCKVDVSSVTWVYSFPSLVTRCAQKPRSNTRWLQWVYCECGGVGICISGAWPVSWLTDKKKNVCCVCFLYCCMTAWPFSFIWNSSSNQRIRKQSTYFDKYCKHPMAIFRNQHIIQPTTVITIIFTILQKKKWIRELISKQYSQLISKLRRNT